MSNLNHSPRAEPRPPPYLRKTTSGVANGARRIAREACRVGGLASEPRRGSGTRRAVRFAGHDLQTRPCPQNETSRSSEDHSLTDQEPTLGQLWRMSAIPLLSPANCNMNCSWCFSYFSSGIFLQTTTICPVFESILVVTGRQRHGICVLLLRHYTVLNKLCIRRRRLTADHRSWSWRRRNGSLFGCTAQGQQKRYQPRFSHTN